MGAGLSDAARAHHCGICPRWCHRHHGTPDGSMAVGAGEFGWTDKAMLANAVVRPNGTGSPLRLIDPSQVGNGRARETFLYQALTTGVAGFAQMPLGGPFATPEELTAIQQWIDAGMPG